MSEIKQGYKQTKVGIIPEDWEVVSLNEGAVFLDHKRKPLKDEYRQKIQGQYPYYGASGIIDYVNDYIFDEELILIGEDGANIIDRNSRLVFLANGKYWVNNHAHVLKAKPNFNNYFLCEFLESLKYDKYNTGTAQPKLNKEIVSNIPIIKPPLKEQEKIAEILTTWDEAITKQTELLRAKELQKKALMQKLLSGEVRFSGFTDEWEEVRLGEIGNSFNGLSGKTGEDFGIGEAKYITYKNIFDYSKIKLDIFENVQISNDEKQNLVQFGDIFFTVSSETPEEVGMSSVLLDNVSNTYLNSFCFGYRLNNFNTLDPYFARFYFRSFQMRDKISRLAQGSTRFNLSKNEIMKLKIKLPPFQEQQKIAEVLSLSDNEIDLLKKELEELKLQKKALMQKLLTGQVRVKV